MKVAVTGSSGMIGSAVVTALTQRGDDVVRVVRRPAQAPDEVMWDPAGMTLDPASLEGVHGVVHLAGSSIADHRWTRAVKEEILRSRVDGTRLLADTFAAMSVPPTVWVSGSASGFYGDRGDEVLTETSAAGTSFRTDVVTAWEGATATAPVATRVVLARTGIVVTRAGGILPYLMLPFRFFIGGPLGSGAQWIPWISLEDEVRAILFLLDTSIAGPMNLVGPQPCRQRDLAHALGRAMHRPSAIRTPAWALRLGAGRERVDEALLSSQRMVPSVLEAAGFQFEHRSVEAAIEAALSGR